MGLRRLIFSIGLMLSTNENFVAADTVSADVLATSGQGSNILGAMEFLWGSGLA